MTNSTARIKFASSVLILLLGGCSSHAAHHGPPGQLEIQVSESPHVMMDPDLARTSSALHSYLVGQLAYDKEDFRSATTNLSRAGKLAMDPVPHIHSTLAELLLKEGKLTDALEETNRALRSDPSNTALHLLKAGILEAQEKNDEALAVYSNLLKGDKTLFDAVYLSAALEGLHGDPAQGIDSLQGYLRVNSTNMLGHFLLGALYEKVGSFDKAQQQYHEIVKRSPENISVQFDRLRVLLKAHDHQQAAAVAQELLAKRAAATVLMAEILQSVVSRDHSDEQLLGSIKLFAPGSLDERDIRLKLALAHVQDQKFGDALRDLSLVIARDPDYSVARYYRASIYGGAGRKKEAYEDLFAIKPGQELFVKSRTFAAFLMKQDHDLAGAEKAVREALAADPENKSVFAYLILILRDAKRYHEALDLLDAALKREPNSERLLFNQGIIFNDLERMDDAVATMEKVIVANDRNADALNFVAYALTEEGKELDRAELLVRRALEISPRDGFYLDTLGWIYYQRQLYPQAAETLKKAVELSNGDVVVAEHYGDALLKINNTTEASEVYRTALEKGRDQDPAERTAEVDEAIHRLEDKLSKLVSEYPELVPAPVTLHN